MKTILNILLIAVLQLVLLGSCKNHGNSLTPQFLFDGSAIPVAEDDPDGTVSIPVYLSGESDKTVSVDYTTVDSTAVGGKDFVAITSGSLTFQPGELGKEIKLNIIPDTAGKKDVYFSIELSNPVNGIISRSRIKIKIINVDYANLAWSDEFNLFALNTTFWNYEQGAGGWGNNELQTYTNSIANVHIDTGYLHITAINPSGTSYTSGRITTLGKKVFTYGRIDIRAKTPEGQGIWPALWMMGSNFTAIGWPRCGETDIMELLGHEPSVVHGTAHWFSNDHQSRSNSYTLSTGKFSTGFHVFSLIWTPNKLIWMVDKQQFFYLTRAEMPLFPFDLPQFIICNVAVGGNWPGVPDETTVFPQHLIVDYIRLYQ
jgi:hypothetical protein